MAIRQSEFPHDFLWGASTSAHQVEGNTHNQWTVWELEHAKSLAAQAEYHYKDLDNWDDIKAQAKNPDNYVSGSASDHYARYKEDIELAHSLHMNALRFSVEWSRIEPNMGSWDSQAIAHYREYVSKLKKQGIEPVLTLFHFTVPVWFSEMGGFEKRSNSKYFIRFAEKILTELGGDIRYVITINEPEVYAFESYHLGHWPPGAQSKRAALTVLRNLISVHNQTAKMIHSLHSRYKVSIAKNSNYFYPGDDAVLSVKSAQAMQYGQDDYVLKRVVKQCDFLAVNYYFSHRVYGYRTHNPNEYVSDMGWDMAPADLEFVLERLSRKYKLPIIITENGCADSSDAKRQWWLKETFGAMQRALKQGVELQGYLHWSLLDNFEWDKGKWPRFGLLAVDYTTQERTVRRSARRYGEVVKKIRRI